MPHTRRTKPLSLSNVIKKTYPNVGESMPKEYGSLTTSFLLPWPEPARVGFALL